jgi:transposase
MIYIRLTPEQRHALEQARRLRTSHLAERCLMVLLSDRGQSVPAIAQSTGRHEHTIRSWLKAYMRGGIEGLKATPPSGRTNRKEQAALSLLAQVIPRSPSDYGYLEAGWSTNVLVDSLQRQDVMASASTVKRALKRGGWVYKRFAKTIPAHAPSAAEKKGGWTSSSEKSLPSRVSMSSRSCS